jgi:hypothetical protein
MSDPTSGWNLLWKSEGGTAHYWRDTDDGGAEIKTVTDVAPILEHNKALQNANDGWSPSKEMRRAFSIPLALIEKWRVEEGVNAFDSAFDPDVAAWVARKLNSSEYAHLRTAPGRLGVSNGVLR